MSRQASSYHYIIAMCTVFVVKWFAPLIPYVTYICAYISYICMSNNLHVWIKAQLLHYIITYFAVTCEVEVVVGCVLA